MKNSSLCYLEKDGKYLMLHRIKKAGDENAGKWIGVGGKFEEGESPDECARREIFEETGLSVNGLVLRSVVTFRSDVYETEYMYLFTCKSFSGTLSDCDEGILRWIPKNEVPSLPLWEGDRIFLKLLDERSDFFLLKLCYCGEKLTEAVLDGNRIL